MRVCGENGERGLRFSTSLVPFLAPCCSVLANCLCWHVPTPPAPPSLSLPMSLQGPQAQLWVTFKHDAWFQVVSSLCRVIKNSNVEVGGGVAGRDASRGLPWPQRAPSFFHGCACCTHLTLQPASLFLRYSQLLSSLSGSVFTPLFPSCAPPRAGALRGGELPAALGGGG